MRNTLRDQHEFRGWSPTIPYCVVRPPVQRICDVPFADAASVLVTGTHRGGDVRILRVA